MGELCGLMDDRSDQSNTTEAKRIVGSHLGEVVVPLLLRAAPNRNAAHAPTNRRMATTPEGEGAIRGRGVDRCGRAGVAIRPYVCAHRGGHEEEVCEFIRAKSTKTRRGE